MPQSLAQIYLHIVFSTKNRHPFISANVESELYAYIGGTIKNTNAFPIMISGMEDHIHILTTFPRTISVADFIKRIKTSSSLWIKVKGEEFQYFAWQEGYGVFSVSPTKKQSVINYIANQKIHHKKQSYQEELIRFLNKYEMKYDERYLWD